MRRLVKDVYLGGQGYGPSFSDVEVPDEVARQITNPLAWENGEVPFPAEDTAGESSGPVTAPEPSEAPQGDEKAESATPRASRARKKG